MSYDDLNFADAMKIYRVTTSSETYQATRTHLGAISGYIGSDVGGLRALHKRHNTFISTGLNYFLKYLPLVKTRLDFLTLIECYGLLVKSLFRLFPLLVNKRPLYEHWAHYINFVAASGDYASAKSEIPEFLASLMASLGIVNNTRSIVPTYTAYRRHHDACNPIYVMDVLYFYLQCLSQSNLGVDYCGLVDLIQGLDEWLEVFDRDMAKRSWLVLHIIQNVEFDDETEASASLFAVVLVEHAKVCKDLYMLQLGLKLVIRKKKPFLIQVLKHLAVKFKVMELEDYPGTTDELFRKQLQLHEERGYLQHMICNTIESIISYHLLKDMLRVKSPHLLPVINLISNAGENNATLADLHLAIHQLRCFDENKNDNDDHGPLYCLQGEAFCLRGLCCYEEKPEAFIKDVNEAMRFWSKSDFIYKDALTLAYTTKLLFFVFDILITSHNQDTQQLLEVILTFLKKSKAARMLWQFKSHNSHLGSKIIQNHIQTDSIDKGFLESCGDLSIKKLEGMLPCIHEKAGRSLKSDCMLGHLYFDLSEKMLAMGSMTQALNYAREGRRYRYRLIEESFVLSSKNETGDSVHAFLLNPIVAARSWWLTSEEFVLAPNNNFICFLMSIHQEAKILELMGNSVESSNVLKDGKTLSLNRGCSYFAGRFQAAHSKIYRKSKDFDKAEKEIQEARAQYNQIGCGMCKLFLGVEISRESVKQIITKGSDFHNTPQAAEHHLVQAAMMLTDELKKGCNDWEWSCTLSLLSVKIEIGKHHIYNGRIMEAQGVFLNCIELVYSMYSTPQSQSKTFVDFCGFIEKSRIELSCATHVAHIIYLISWLAYKTSKDTRNNCVDLFCIPLEKLISGLKLALVLSSEVPELSQKVAQLLAIMYFVSDKDITSSKVTNLQWSCFFHQLAIGSEINYAFSHKLREVHGVSDPDNTLHRLTPSADADLTDFVEKFFKDLQPHTILVINIIGSKYKNLLKTLLKSPLPSDCAALLMLSRFNSKRQPLVGLFPVALEQVPPVPPVPESGEPWQCPWGTDTIVDMIAPAFKRIIKDFQDSRDQTVLDKLDDRMGTLLSRMQSWFGGHEYAMLGEPVGSPKNLNLDYFSGFVGLGVNDISLASTTHEVSTAYCGKSKEGAFEREPVILVLDKTIQMLPWERMEASNDHEYYRMPSVSSTFYTCYIRDKSGIKTERHSADYAIIDPFDTYFLIMPDGSTNQEQKDEEEGLAKYLKNELNLDGSMWRHVGDEIIDILKTRSFFVYAGHGDGLNYMPEGGAELRTFDRCASVSLIGCSSGLFRLTGPYTPTAAPINYLLGGSPIIISNLYNVYASWAGYFYEGLFRRSKDKDRLSIGSCVVEIRNSLRTLVMGCGAVIYGIPTLMQKGTNCEF